MPYSFFITVLSYIEVFLALSTYSRENKCGKAKVGRGWLFDTIHYSLLLVGQIVCPYFRYSLCNRFPPKIRTGFPKYKKTHAAKFRKDRMVNESSVTLRLKIGPYYLNLNPFANLNRMYQVS